MKTNYIYVAAVALAMMATGCSDDQLVQIQESASNGHQVRVTASMEAESRLAITDTGKRLEFTWEDDDVFHVFDPAHQQTTKFAKEADASAEPSPYGTFVGTPQVAYQDGNKLYAVYNQQGEFQLDENGNVTLDISGQTGKLEDRFQFMYAESTFSEGEKPAFAFKHLVTMTKLNITVPEDVTQLKEINFYCYDMPTKATLVLTGAANDAHGMFSPGDLVSLYDHNKTYTDILTIKGEFVPVNGVVTVYLYLFPVKNYYDDHSWYNDMYVEPAVWMTDTQNRQYVGTASFNQKKIESGKTYQLNTEVHTLVPFANENTATGSASSPYEIANADQLYSFMLRTAKGMKNSEDKSFRNCHYKLTADIQLNNEMVWEPGDLYNAVFDGQGHTLSGDLTIHNENESGLFRFLSSTTVQNLILDMNVTLDHQSTNERFGLLAADIYDSRILNCINRSDVSVPHRKLGGLIGQVRENSEVIACVNTGSLYTNKHSLAIGGIAAELFDQAYVEGCYNTGELRAYSVNYEGIQAGGIAGSMRWNNQLVVQSCWSKSKLTIENIIYNDHYVEDNNNIYFGGIVGYQEIGSINHCYWGSSAAAAVGYQGGSVTGGGKFSDDIPSKDQLEIMNQAFKYTEWQFNTENGTVEPVSSIVVPSLPKEDW